MQMCIRDRLVAADVVLHDDIPPIELVPHDAVVEAGRLLHQAAGKLRFIHFDIRGHVAVNRRFAGRFALGEAGAVIADDEVGLCFHRGFDQQARGVGVELVIGIDELQILPRGALDGDVARAGNTAVFLVDDDDARIQTCLLYTSVPGEWLPPRMDCYRDDRELSRRTDPAKSGRFSWIAPFHVAHVAYVAIFDNEPMCKKAT